jgi:preprotein translocase subunit SecA
MRQAVAPYAERAAPPPSAFDLFAASAWGALQTRLPGPLAIAAHAAQIEAIAAGLADRSDAALLAEAAALRPALLQNPAGLHTHAFALVHAAVERRLGLRYFPVQLAGGRELTRRRVVEMATGEGKTITAILPAAALALAGRPVHVVTANGYLAARDAERLRPVYASLGLSVGLVLEGHEPALRRKGYAADVTYVTAKELAFDYLRDRIATAAARGAARHAVSALLGPAGHELILRGLHAAVIDEADFVLIDEARTPMVISADRRDSTLAELADQALGIARGLSGEHFAVDEVDRELRLTPSGRAAVAGRSAGMAGVFAARQAREELVAQALSALHLFERDRHYIVADGEVRIVDEHTGRLMPGRTWQQGLHQLVEAKEGVALTGARETLARITTQRFFNRYLHLCGMTGTAREVAGELRAVYGLRVVRLPPNRPLLRRDAGATLVRDAGAKWDAVARRAAATAACGRPVLIGTQSVADSDALSLVLTERGLPHVVLNARQDAAEAEVLARAGAPGRITVATEMAGRGADILLAPGVAEAGGLHVILAGCHEGARIDRQLFGRAGRQGDPGSHETVAALDDDLFRRFAPRLSALVARLRAPGVAALRLLRRRAQSVAFRVHARRRREQASADEQLQKALGFAGLE